LLHTVPSLPEFVVRLCYMPNPLSPKYDAKEPFIGASYQRITELLAGMCADKTIDAQIVVQHVADAVVNPTELALSGRAEGMTNTPASQPAPSTAPATNPAAGARQ